MNGLEVTRQIRARLPRTERWRKRKSRLPELLEALRQEGCATLTKALSVLENDGAITIGLRSDKDSRAGKASCVVRRRVKGDPEINKR